MKKGRPLLECRPVRGEFSDFRRSGGLRFGQFNNDFAPDVIGGTLGCRCRPDNNALVTLEHLGPTGDVAGLQFLADGVMDSGEGA